MVVYKLYPDNWNGTSPLLQEDSVPRGKLLTRTLLFVVNNVMQHYYDYLIKLLKFNNGQANSQQNISKT